MIRTLVGAHFEALSQNHVLLRARARRHRASVQTGPFSVKGLIAGEAVWQVGGDRFRVDRDSHLVLDRGEPYTLDIDEAQPVETFVAFLADAFVSDLSAARFLPAQRLLGDPAAPSWLPVTRRLWTGPTRLRAAMGTLRGLADAGGEQGEFDLALRGLLDACADLTLEACREADRIPAVRASTRVELHRRVLRGKAYLDDTYDQPFDLARAAAEAALATHHFHRTFRSALRQAPYAYVAGRRIDKARLLIEMTDMPLAEVCASVGYESLPSFLRAFRKRVGETPTTLRARIRKEG